MEAQLLKDLELVSKILLKYGVVEFESGLVKKDVDPRKWPHQEYIFKLIVNTNKKASD